MSLSLAPSAVAAAAAAAAAAVAGMVMCGVIPWPHVKSQPAPENDPAIPAPEREVEPLDHFHHLARLGGTGWERVGIGSGQLRWVENKKTSKQRKAPGTSSSAGGEADRVGSKTTTRRKVSFSSLAMVPAASDQLNAAQQLMDQAYSVCPVVPIHTTYQSPSAKQCISDEGRRCDEHQRLVLRKAGKGECVARRPQLATQAIVLGQQALASLHTACQLEPSLSAEPAVRKTLDVWRARLADFEEVRVAPLPRPIAEFNEDWRSEAVLSYCAATHRLREAMCAIVRMGWAAESPETPFVLEQLHTLPTDRGIPGCPAVLYAFKHAGMAMPQSWTAFLKPGKRGRQRHIKEFRASPQCARHHLARTHGGPLQLQFDSNLVSAQVPEIFARVSAVYC